MKILIENIKALKILLKVAPKQDVRFYLNGIFFDIEKQKAVSTDGHMMAVASIIAESDLESSVIVGLSDRQIPAKTESVVIYQDHAICFSLPGGIGERLKMMPIELISGDYPNWEKVTTHDKPNIEMDSQWFNPALLSRLTQVIHKDGAGVRLNFKGRWEAIHVKFSGSLECVDAFVMPMRDPKEEAA